MPTGHDEDADGIDDGCDVCPAIADAPQADRDGDRVGDPCDPEPDTSRQQIVFFDPFATLDPAVWDFMGAERAENDELVLDAIGSSRSIRRPYTLADDSFIVGATAGDAGPTGNYLISLTTSDSVASESFYCEMFDDGATRTMFTYYQGTYLHDGVAAWPGSRLANGSGVFEYTLTPTTARCRSAWREDDLLVVGAKPTTIVPDTFIIYAQNVDATIAYVLQIRTTP